MSSSLKPTSFGSHFSQVCWVVRDIQKAEKFFKEVIGISTFTKLENLSARDHAGTYFGKPGNFVFHLYMGYSGESMIELIQPVSGQSIFQDFLDKTITGGIQDVAYSVPAEDLDTAISQFTKKGYPVITSLNLPVANVVFFDTTEDIGVITEIIGVTDAGMDFVQQLRIEAFA